MYAGLGAGLRSWDLSWSYRRSTFFRSQSGFRCNQFTFYLLPWHIFIAGYVSWFSENHYERLSEILARVLLWNFQILPFIYWSRQLFWANTVVHLFLLSLQNCNNAVINTTVHNTVINTIMSSWNQEDDIIKIINYN